jgi:hypothetical protein
MKARIALLISLLLLGGIGAEWWLDYGTDPGAATDVRKMDGGEGDPPPPSPHP